MNRADSRERLIIGSLLISLCLPDRFRRHRRQIGKDKIHVLAQHVGAFAWLAALML